MSRATRVWIAIGILAALVALMLAFNTLQRRAASTAEVPAGSIPLYLDAEFVIAFDAGALEVLEKTGFEDAEEGKTQEGWLLREIIALFVDTRDLQAGSEIRVISSSRDREATVLWSQVNDPANRVLMALSNRGTLKLVSVMEELDTRNEWVQDVDRIEVIRP